MDDIEKINESRLKEIARRARIKVLDLIYGAQTSHIGSNFSCIDILTVLFDKIDLDKDRLVVSKGWVAASLYYFLWMKGRITEEELNSYCQPGSKFIGLSEPITKDILIAGGSMGMGLPGAVGLALAKKLKGEEGTVYCLMSDGEMAIGTTWEAALIAAHHKIDNLSVFCDWNGLQAMGAVEDILEIHSVWDLVTSWGWEYSSIDGHDHRVIEEDLSSPTYGVPKFMLARTIKGKGVSFMEDNNLYHYKAPNKEEYEQALKELA